MDKLSGSPQFFSFLFSLSGLTLYKFLCFPCFMIGQAYKGKKRKRKIIAAFLLQIVRSTFELRDVVAHICKEKELK
jgi:hypothetical protein